MSARGGYKKVGTEEENREQAKQQGTVRAHLNVQKNVENTNPPSKVERVLAATGSVLKQSPEPVSHTVGQAFSGASKVMKAGRNVLAHTNNDNVAAAEPLDQGRDNTGYTQELGRPQDHGYGVMDAVTNGVSRRLETTSNVVASVGSALTSSTEPTGEDVRKQNTNQLLATNYHGTAPTAGGGDYGGRGSATAGGPLSSQGRGGGVGGYGGF